MKADCILSFASERKFLRNALISWFNSFYSDVNRKFSAYPPAVVKK